jgi:branched-chain amino acid transport system ATP-binding protein
VDRLLLARGLQLKYPNGALGISDVSMEIAAGQVVLLVGSNGAGKTTTARAISGFMRSEGARLVGGSVTLFGVDTTNCEPHRTTTLGLAFIPERRKIFPNMTVAENLAVVGRRPPRSRRREIRERIHALFPDLVTHQHQLAGRLSGGQQQMVAIARSLMCEPQLLIVDELTLGLHISLHAPLFTAMKEIAAAGTAVLIIDESMHDALAVADYCYLLDSGSVSREGPPSLFKEGELTALTFGEDS